MAGKIKKLQAGTLNIVLHPHSPRLYVKLLTEAKRLKVAGKINVNKRARFGSLDRFESYDGKELLGGLVYFYTDLNPDEPWLDDDTGEAADEEQIAHLKQQIKKLHPEFRTMRYVFDPSSHKFYFQIKNEEGGFFSPSTVEKALTSIFTHERLLKEFGECEVTVVPATDALDKILKIKSLRKLIIDIKTPPNPDGQADAFDEVEQRMDEMGARRMEIALTKAPGVASLTPDDELILLAQVAAANGKVTGIGYNNAGTKVEESTTQHPQILTFDFVPRTSPLQSFRSFIVSKLSK